MTTAANSNTKSVFQNYIDTGLTHLITFGFEQTELETKKDPEIWVDYFLEGRTAFEAATRIGRGKN